MKFQLLASLFVVSLATTNAAGRYLRNAQGGDVTADEVWLFSVSATRDQNEQDDDCREYYDISGKIYGVTHTSSYQTGDTGSFQSYVLANFAGTDCSDTEPAPQELTSGWCGYVMLQRDDDDGLSLIGSREASNECDDTRFRRTV
ncbi:expressed unknown protein [Seminavis robusta]|uniref:Uncharacterized protein n=1 Tax=Seminavis robusta TaxID=568900 RepID=A0A9N8DTF3_9STRA|nr:expressed unknown protein [Seminavis robusta]|eukprot:Sro357_g125650.1 n/a (145) ;mRNA; r:35908-36342